MMKIMNGKTIQRRQQQLTTIRFLKLLLLLIAICCCTTTRTTGTINLLQNVQSFTIGTTTTTSSIITTTTTKTRTTKTCQHHHHHHQQRNNNRISKMCKRMMMIPNDLNMIHDVVDVLNQNVIVIVDDTTTTLSSSISSSSILLLSQTLTDPTTIVDSVSSVSSVSSSSSSSYSQLSYFTVLGLYIMSFPGLWSIISRSTSAKNKQKTFISPGIYYNKYNSTTTSTTTSNRNNENEQIQQEFYMNKTSLSLKDQAIEIMAYMKGNNYQIKEMTNTTITFQGIVQRSVSQAFFLVFCTILGLLSLGLVLQIQFQNSEIELLRNMNWYTITLLSPYAGIYYWKNGDRIDTIQIQLSCNEEETMNEISIYGNDDEIERMWRTLYLQEKNMIPVNSILQTTKIPTILTSSNK